MTSVQLSSGVWSALVTLGTWQISPADVGAAVSSALAAGVRHIDCASIYRNEWAVGVALSEALSLGTVIRNELFVPGKLWNTDHSSVRASCLRSLADLRLDRSDQYLVHWPIVSGASAGTSIEQVWRSMEGWRFELQRAAASGFVGFR